MKELEHAKFIALEAGKLLKQYFNRSLDYQYKNDKSLVSEADLAANETIISYLKLHFPNCSIHSEESNQEYYSSENDTWIIDPLDGTHNFLRQISL